MVLVEAVVVFGLLGLITYVTIQLLTRPPERRPALRTGRWCAVHYDAEGETRVAVQRVADGSHTVLDEHLVARIPVADPEYDARFLAAMAAARERQALFEAEEE
jgi:FAD/FMN-containing dehydrogenase